MKYIKSFEAYRQNERLNTEALSEQFYNIEDLDRRIAELEAELSQMRNQGEGGLIYSSRSEDLAYLRQQRERMKKHGRGDDRERRISQGYNSDEYRQLQQGIAADEQARRDEERHRKQQRIANTDDKFLLTIFKDKEGYHVSMHGNRALANKITELLSDTIDPNTIEDVIYRNRDVKEVILKAKRDRGLSFVDQDTYSRLSKHSAYKANRDEDEYVEEAGDEKMTRPLWSYIEHVMEIPFRSLPASSSQAA